MSSVGERLRLERQKQGLSLTQVAEKTRISQRHLTAIETGDIKGLPGEFFYRSFVRQYARTLGLDEGEFDGDFEQMFPRTADAQFPIPEISSRRIEVAPIERVTNDRRWPWSLLALALVVIACTALYAWWQKLRMTPAERPPAVVEQQQTPAQTPVNTAQQPPSQQPQQQQQQQPAEQGAGQTPPEPAPAVPEAKPAAPAVPPPAATPSTAAGEIGSGNLALEITATEDTWFSVKTGGKTLFSNILKKGQTKTIRAEGAADLLIGNAGGLNVVRNGKPLGPIGPLGQIRRVRVTAEGAQVTNPRAEREQQRAAEPEP